MPALTSGDNRAAGHLVPTRDEQAGADQRGSPGYMEQDRAEYSVAFTPCCRSRALGI